MDCRDLENYLSALLDGELEASKQLVVQSHLETCQACHKEYNLLKITKGIIRQNIPHEKAPVHLRNRIVEIIEEEKAERTRQWEWPWIHLWFLQPRAFIPAVTVLIIIGSLIIYSLSYRSASARLVTALITAHDHYESAEVPIEMITSNPQQLSAWFSNKVDFSFEVPRLEQVNLNLIGGDVMGLTGLKGAHMMYHGPTGHKTSLFIFKYREKRLSFKKMRQKGYEFYISSKWNHAVLFWKKGVLIYSLICPGEDHIRDLVHCALLVRKE